MNPALQEGRDFDFEDTIEKMKASLLKMDLEKVKKEDVARAGGYGGGGDEE